MIERVRPRAVLWKRYQRVVADHARWARAQRGAGIGRPSTYADILRVPIDVAYSPDELTARVIDQVDREFIIVDTPGRSQRNANQIEELKQYVAELAGPRGRARVMVDTGVLDEAAVPQHAEVTTQTGRTDRECRGDVAGAPWLPPQQVDDASPRRISECQERIVDVGARH